MENSTSLWLKKIRRRQDLMDSVMERCEVDPLAAVRVESGEAFFLARAKCRQCLHEDDCRNWWLETSGSLPPNFCPNADFLRACKREYHSLKEQPALSCGTVVKRPERPPNVSFEQRASRELIQLVWKLRWLREEDEAKKAQMQLTRILARMQLLNRSPCASDDTLGMLNDTD